MLLDTDAYLRRQSGCRGYRVHAIKPCGKFCTISQSLPSSDSRLIPKSWIKHEKHIKRATKGHYTVCATLSAPTGRASSFNLGLRTLKQTSQRLNIPQTNIPQVSATSEWHTKLATTIYRYTYMYSKVTSSKLTMMIRQCCSHKYYFESWNTPKRKTQKSTLTHLRPKHESVCWSFWNENIPQVSAPTSILARKWCKTRR